MTKANNVTKHVMKATGVLQIEGYHFSLDITNTSYVFLQIDVAEVQNFHHFYQEGIKHLDVT
jgi:hypothetical protein